MATDFEWRGRIHTVLVLAFCVALLIAPFGTADARTKLPLAVTVGVTNVKATSLVVSLNVKTARRARCTPRVSARGLSAPLPGVVASAAGRASVRWTVEAGAPRGLWTFTVRCVKARLSRTVVKKSRISIGRGGRGSLVAPGTLKVTVGASIEPPTSQAAYGKGAGGNPFPAGWCTWGAWDKAQWLGGAVTGNANQWAAQAARAGLQVGTVPAVDAVYVNTAGYYGHVGVVTKVNSATNFDMVDMNGGTLLKSPPAEYGKTTDFGVFRLRSGRSTGSATRFIYKPGTNGGTAGGTGPGSSSATAGQAGGGGAPTAVSWGSGRIDVFALGTNNRLLHWYYGGDGFRGPFEENGSQPLGSTPAVASWGPNRLDLFARGPAGDLIHGYYDGAFHPWEPLSANGLLR